ncbi:MAG: cell division protein ZapE [Alphaproteobacteria bacterium]|nr:cell division protein ZapE [Alphaproteobacteria bacterium]
MRGPLHRYRALVAAGALEPDPAQERAAERLQALEDALARARRFRLFAGPQPAPRGVYLWGEVGRGKSLLMDIFFNNSAARAKRRVHFHEFMAETHERIARFRALDARKRKRAPGTNPKSIDDPMPPVAFEITDETKLLCLDEFQVRDIADAMILGRLFDALFARGLVVVATSNRPPDELYWDGINRQLFLPFIDMLKSRLDVLELEAARDYRLARLTGAPVYYRPLGPDADEAMDDAWAQLICGAREREEKLYVQGRMLIIPRVARDAARFHFRDLCQKPLGAADYLAIARRYGAIFIDRIPRMSPDMRDAARRFINLIDALYDTRTKLVCSADGEPADLYPAGDGAVDFGRTVSRLLEMRSADYLGAERTPKAANA